MNAETPRRRGETEEEMPFDDEILPYAEPDPSIDVLTRAIIGAAIEVHRMLGPGLDEALYEAALCIELRLRNIPFRRQVVIPVLYKGTVIGEKRLDLIVDDKVIAELKAVEELGKVHKAQLHTYLKITMLPIGLLINFNTPVLKEGIKRIIRV